MERSKSQELVPERKAFRAALTAGEENTIGLPKLFDEAEPAFECGAEEFCRQTLIKVFASPAVRAARKSGSVLPDNPRKRHNTRYRTENFKQQIFRTHFTKGWDKNCTMKL